MQILIKMFAKYNSHNSYKDFIIKIIKAFIRKKIFPKTHLLNNLRCESHRWTIARAIKIQKKFM